MHNNIVLRIKDPSHNLIKLCFILYTNIYIYIFHLNLHITSTIKNEKKLTLILYKVVLKYNNIRYID